MWCAECQLDVPALAVPEEPGVIRCAYCRGELTSRHEEFGDEPSPQPIAAAASLAVAQAPSEPPEEPVPRLRYVPPPPIDDWRADAELRRMERLVSVLRQSHGSDSDVRSQRSEVGRGRIASDLCSLAASHSPQTVATSTAARSSAEVAAPAGEKTGLAAWACLTLGLMAFVCGGVLLIWSFVTGRGDLWSLGVPLTLAGQVGLVLGLLLQLDGLSQSSRRTEQTLTDLDGQLGQLRSVTSQMSATHSGPAHSFYAHLTEGASPQILLADLKGQLDLLAQQMARQHKAA